MLYFRGNDGIFFLMVQKGEKSRTSVGKFFFRHRFLFKICTIAGVQFWKTILFRKFFTEPDSLSYRPILFDQFIRYYYIL